MAHGAEKRRLTPREMAELVLCSLRVYHDFAYTKWPSAQAFFTLWHARQALLAFYAGKRLPLTPTYRSVSRRPAKNAPGSPIMGNVFPRIFS